MSPLLWVCRLVQIRTKYSVLYMYTRACVRIRVRGCINEQRQKTVSKKYSEKSCKKIWSIKNKSLSLQHQNKPNK